MFPLFQGFVEKRANVEVMEEVKYELSRAMRAADDSRAIVS